MKITILSGGSGNSELIKGLKSFYRDADIKVLLSAFDSGKSTGVCRKVTNTLGVSDIRKNHIRMYKTVSDVVDRRLVDLFEGRYDITPDNKSLLYEDFGIDEYWKPEYGCKKFTDYIEDFFNLNENSGDFSYNNFCIGNILYSQMYQELGYKKTNSIMCDVLGIDDFVVMNTYDNVYLKARMSDGTILEDEGDIVDFADFNKKIVDTYYDPELPIKHITQEAFDAIKDCNLFIISTGTFWSSIYPTLQYGDLYKYVNMSDAKKIWAINNEYDRDSYGVSSNEFIDKMEELGLNLSEFTILENKDAIEALREPNDRYNVIVRSMGNHKGKHNSELYCKEILRAYYNLKPLSYYDRVIFDFDDTLWSRDYKNNEKLYKVSKENIELINNNLNTKSLIISGNSYSSMLPKLRSVFGIDLEYMSLSIWTCAEAAKHVGNKIVKKCDSLSLNIEEYTNLLTDLTSIVYPSKITTIGYDTFCNIRIKPLQAYEREILYKYISDVIIPKYENIAVYKTGRSTIDIVHKDNNKSYLFDIENLDELNTLYIGDEIDSGNDRDIAVKCTDAVSTSGVEETNILLKLLIEG